MLTGFEQETKPLTDYEMTLLPLFIEVLKGCTGKEEAIKSHEIADWLISKGYKNILGARIRKIINHIRNHNLIIGLMASSSGYYISNNAVEITGYIKSLDGRIDAITAVKEKFEQYRNKLLSQ